MIHRTHHVVSLIFPFNIGFIRILTFRTFGHFSNTVFLNSRDSFESLFFYCKSFSIHDFKNYDDISTQFKIQMSIVFQLLLKYLYDY